MQIKEAENKWLKIPLTKTSKHLEIDHKLQAKFPFQYKKLHTYSVALIDLFSFRDLSLFLHSQCHAIKLSKYVIFLGDLSLAIGQKLFQLTYLPIIISKIYLNQHKIPLSSLLSHKRSQYIYKELVHRYLFSSVCGWYTTKNYNMFSSFVLRKKAQFV